MIGGKCSKVEDCGAAPVCKQWHCSSGYCLSLPQNLVKCEDGDPCTVGDACLVGVCQKGKPNDCDDGDPCTADACDKQKGCSHPIAKDGKACAPGKTCQAGKCAGGVSVGAVHVDAADDQTCALLKDGAVFCWGNDKEGQAGDGKADGKWHVAPSPVQLPAKAVALDCGGQHCCAVVGKEVHCWGQNQFGQVLKDGAQSIHGPQLPGVGDTSMVAIGEFHSCALVSGGGVKCWGLGSSGQLGDGKGQTKSGPVAVLLGDDASAIASGRTHSCAIVSGGKIKCWGLNNEGQLGIGSAGIGKTEDTPKEVVGITGATAIGLGRMHSCAVVAGKVKCWGNGSGYKLGSQSSTYKHTPKDVPGISGVSQVCGGDGHTCALAGGDLFCWGANTYGQAAPGDSTYIIKAPTKATGVAKAKQISCGRAHTCILDHDGGTWCWGDGNLGQLGNGGNKPSKTPALVK